MTPDQLARLLSAPPREKVVLHFTCVKMNA